MSGTVTEPSHTLHLLAWLSPAFPVGAFAYSHGLETAVDLGDIGDAATLTSWLSDLLEHGSIRNDLVLAAAAWTAADARDRAVLDDANDLALALSSGRERRLETSAMGRAFATAIDAAWSGGEPPLWPQGEVAYPVAYGAACAVQYIPLAPALEAYAFAFTQNLVSAAVRLGPIGQTDGQRVLAALMPAARNAAECAVDSSLDDVGGCTLRSDLAAMRHETLYSRLFRS